MGSGGREGAEVVGEGKEEGTEDVTGRRELREGEEGNEDGIVESTENKSRPACLREGNSYPYDLSFLSLLLYHLFSSLQFRNTF